MRRGHFNKPSMAGGRLLKIKDEKDTTFLNIMPNKLTHSKTPPVCVQMVLPNLADALFRHRTSMTTTTTYLEKIRQYISTSEGQRSIR